MPHTIEVARVFGLPLDEAMKTLEALEKAGGVERATLADALHWRAKER